MNYLRPVLASSGTLTATGIVRKPGQRVAFAEGVVEDAEGVTLATATCYRFSNGRFYCWEGAYCCAGTCQHVWQYAQGAARIFPALERYLREQIDFGQSFHESGELDYRGEAAKSVAHDGMAGTIVRAYREHLTSADDAISIDHIARNKAAALLPQIALKAS